MSFVGCIRPQCEYCRSSSHDVMFGVEQQISAARVRRDRCSGVQIDVVGPRPEVGRFVFLPNHCTPYNTKKICAASERIVSKKPLQTPHQKHLHDGFVFRTGAAPASW